MSRKTLRTALVATCLALAPLTQPAFAAGPEHEMQAQAASARAWVDYWLGFLANLDRVSWATGA